YQDSAEGLVVEFKAFENVLKSMQDKEVLSKSQHFLNLFTIFNDAFYYHYIKYIEDYENGDITPSESIKERHRLYIEVCTLNISRINSLYVSPFSNRITIKKANRSIALGWGSILIGLAATGISLYFSLNSDKTIKSFKQDLLKQKSIIFENNKYVNTIDSYIFRKRLGVCAKTTF
ncbi:MAG: hypothetical protein U1D64_05590, partial [Bacteroidales bacterium]|nr:hypothetical protein [Bacteroidales bacterium]